MSDFGRFTVGYFRDGEWYFNGEYGETQAAEACAQKTANEKKGTARVTDQKTGQVKYFDPTLDTTV